MTRFQEGGENVSKLASEPIAPPRTRIQKEHDDDGENRWGLNWQITPRALTEAFNAGGDEAKRAFSAMMTMKKIDVAAIEAARRG